MPLGPHGFLAVEESNPDGVAAVLRAKAPRQFEHYTGRGPPVVGADEVFKTLCVVMGTEENHAGTISRNLDEYVFHGQAAGGSIRADGIGIHGAAVAFQFG